MSGPRFELQAVSKRYDGRIALSNVSLSIVAERHTAILGPTGCGKSTILRLLTGLETPSEGHVLLDDTVVSAPGRVLTPPHRRSVAMVFQDLALWPNLSVLDNVRLGQSGQGLSRHECRTRAIDALSLCGIASLQSRAPGALSGGQQQRVALARALATAPDFLFLDEPFASLDLVTKARLLDEIVKLADQRNVTLLLVTHDPREAIGLCRAAVVLDRGTIQESGDLHDLLRAPQSQILRVFREQASKSA